MACPLSNRIAASHGPGPHPLHGNALVHIGLGDLECIQISHLFLLRIRHRGIQQLLDDTRGVERCERENIDGISHHFAPDKVYYLPRLARSNAYMSYCCACFHLIILTLLSYTAFLSITSVRSSS